MKTKRSESSAAGLSPGEGEVNESPRPDEDCVVQGMVEVCDEEDMQETLQARRSHSPPPPQASGVDTDDLLAQEIDAEISASAAVGSLSGSACEPDATGVPKPSEGDKVDASNDDASGSTVGASVDLKSDQRSPMKDNDSGVDRDQEEAGTEGKGLSSDISHNREFQAVKLAAVQLLAIKTLSSIITCGRFRELLLVPRATPQPDGSQEKSLLEDLAAQKDEDLKSAVRSIVRHLVHRATMPSPFRRVVSLSELERSFTVLHTDIIRTMAEEQLGLPVVEGQWFVSSFQTTS